MSNVKVYIDDLASRDKGLNLKQFTDYMIEKYKPQMDSSKASEILEMIQDTSCHIPDDKLYEYGVLTMQKSRNNHSNDVKRMITAYNLEEDTEYLRRNIAPHSRRSYKYYLSPEGFNICLMRSKNHPEYARWFHFMLQVKTYYELYQYAITVKIIEGEKSELVTKCDTLICEVADLRTDNKQLLSKCDQLLENNKSMDSDLADITENVEELQTKLDIALPDRVPHCSNNKKLETFLLIRLNKPHPCHDYYVVRGQAGYVNRRYKSIKRRDYPDAEIALNIQSCPNPKNLYVRVLENLKDCTQHKGNYISPEGISHEEFIQEIRRLNNEKYNI